MKIIKLEKHIVKVEHIKHQKTDYYRSVASDGTISWEYAAADGEVDEEYLEEKYQELINRPPKVYHAVRDKEGVGKFNEIIRLYDREKEIARSTTTHPESYFTFVYEGVEYFSLPYSEGKKPVYHRIIKD